MARTTVADIKKEIGWTTEGPMCANCRWYSSEIIPAGPRKYYKKEINKRCTRHTFATKKRAWCMHYEKKGV